MNLNKARLCNLIWLLSQKGENKEWRKGINNPEKIQLSKLFYYTRTNSNTSFGIQHEFKSIVSYSDYVNKVPIIEDRTVLNEWITQIVEGSENVLTADKVIGFEETSGTSGSPQLIPYTATLKKEFSVAVATWMNELNSVLPSTFNGRCYWSLSPATRQVKRTASGLQIGLDNDMEYFRWPASTLLKQILALPPATSKITEAKAFYDATILNLLQCNDLSFISVWSPSFFLKLDEHLRSRITELPSLLQKKTPEQFKKNIAAITAGATWKEIWPGLSCFSSWTDAQSTIWLPQVKKILGDVAIQPKGLLATEGVTSIPIAMEGSAAAFTSHFYEFRDVTNGQILLLHEILENKTYEVILTTGGGLYRYATNDLISVTGYLGKVPQMVFVGRKNKTVDMVGEKLAEVEVNKAISVLMNRYPSLSIAILLPVNDKQCAGYVLVTDGEDNINRLSETLQQILCAGNPYFKHAIDIGQLSAIKHFYAPARQINHLLLELAGRKYKREGDAKIPTLLQVDMAAELLKRLSA